MYVKNSKIKSLDFCKVGDAFVDSLIRILYPILFGISDTQRERDKYAKEYEDLQVLCDVVQEQLDEELKGNTVLRNTVEELKQRVMDLEQQLCKSEAERLKLAEKLKTLCKRKKIILFTVC